MTGHRQRGFLAVNKEEIQDNESDRCKDSYSKKEWNRSATGIFMGCLVLFLFADMFFLQASQSNNDDDDTATKKIQCHSISIDQKSLITNKNSHHQTFIPEKYNLLQTTIHMRHFDRWMYSHPFIHNMCWTNELNSSSSDIMKNQCEYNLSSVWQNFTFDEDPYAYPLQGYCNAKQLTKRGMEHAQLFGQILHQHFIHYYNNINDGKLCHVGTIKLESDEEQKNQLTTQFVYHGLCNTFPNVTEEHTYENTINDGTIAKNRPFFLQTSICPSEYYRNMLDEAHAAFYKDIDIINKMKAISEMLANMTGKDVPSNIQDLPTFLDNVEDCVVCHECHGLNDTPRDIWKILDQVDRLETLSRLYPFYYYHDDQNHNNATSSFHGDEENEKDEHKMYKRFVSNYYGYYFVTILHRMKQAIQYWEHKTNIISKNDNHLSGDKIPAPLPPPPPLLYLQVTADSILSPQLFILNATTNNKSLYSKRPVWGSQIVYQLLEQQNEFYVRILYEGQVLWNITSFERFEIFVESIAPTVEDCGIFYENFLMD